MANRGRQRREGKGFCDGESSESIEEISADDFRDTGRSRSRVWMDYQARGAYGQSLSSFAWAQAVQNKPLCLELMPMRAGDLARSDRIEEEDRVDLVIDVSSSRESESGDEREDGEIEEGEIDSGVEQVLLVDQEMVDDGFQDKILVEIVVDGYADKLEDVDAVADRLGVEEKPDENELVEMKSKDISDAVADKLGEEDKPDEKELVEMVSHDISEFNRQMALVLEELNTVTAEEAEVTFDVVCAKLHKCFKSMETILQRIENGDDVLIALVHQALLKIQSVYLVLKDEKFHIKEEHKDLFLRLLLHIKNQCPIRLTPDQINEIDNLLESVAFKDDKKGKESCRSRMDVDGQSLDSSVSSTSNPSTRNILGSGSERAGLPKLDIPSLSIVCRPLLDLHADHNEGSLPSPTRENPSQFRNRSIVSGTIETASYLSVTEALKVVSSYEQKYGRISFPESPTPSEEHNDNTNDLCSEVFSSVISGAATPNAFGQFQVSSIDSNSTKSSINDQVGPVNIVSQVGLNKLALKPSSKSRDPRLRFLKPEISRALEIRKCATETIDTANDGLGSGLMNKKQKTADDSLCRDYAFKRQKTGFYSSEDHHMQFSRGSWLEDMSQVGSLSRDSMRLNEIDCRKQGTRELNCVRIYDACNSFVGVDGTNRQNPSSIPAPAVSFPSLLQAVNPTTPTHIVQIQEQRLASGNDQQIVDSLQVCAKFSSVNVLPGIVSSMATNPVQANEASASAPATSKMSSQAVTSTLHNSVVRQMKPRDPRRILYGDTVKENKNLDCEQMKNGVTLSGAPISTDRMDLLTSCEQVGLAQFNQFPSQSVLKPEINKQLTQNLKPLADSNESMTTPVATSQGADIGNLQPVKPWRDVDHLLSGYDDEQKATIQRERARRIDEQNKMFAARKLCLVLDLDHTLLNSAKFVEVDPAHEEILRTKEVLDGEKPLRHLFRFQHMGMWTKLRPGVWNFLEKASKSFELHLYTMGNKLYATEMAKLLDPTGTLFSGRVMARGDDSDILNGEERAPKSKDLEGVLGMESAVVIIDDSVRVWPHNKHNLIVVERYTYFPCSRRQFGLPGPSLLEIDHDERPEDGTLASALAVIERIHQRFFSHVSLDEVDVRNLLASEKRKILRGCKIVFSRIIPVTEKKPQLHPFWQMAEQFGAVCTTSCDNTVTHVVAKSLGTDKVNWALNKKKFVVHPGWLEASALLYRRAKEQDFAVTKIS